MEMGVYLKEINSQEILNEEIPKDNILGLICDFKTKRSNYMLHYNNLNSTKFKPSISICDVDKVLFYDRFFVHRKIEKFLQRKKQPETNTIKLEDQLDMRDLGKLVENCEKSFKDVQVRVFLSDLPKENNFSEDKIRYDTFFQAFLDDYSISYLNDFF